MACVLIGVAELPRKPKLADPVETPKKRAKPAAKKLAPELAAKARELRDRYLEAFNEQPPQLSNGKYDVARLVEQRSKTAAEPMKMLEAA